MATSFPGQLDVFENPDADTRQDDSAFYHDVVHANVNDALEAIEAKVGIDDSADPDSLDKRVADLEGAGPVVTDHGDLAGLADDDHGQYHNDARGDARYVQLGEKGAADGVATLGADSKIPSAQLPALAIGEVFTVASEAAMLALAAQRGDVAVRTDLDPDRLFLLTTDSPGTLGDWVEITAAGAVQTVNGQSGAVVLDAADVGAETEAGAQAKVDAHVNDADAAHAASAIAATPFDSIAGDTVQEQLEEIFAEAAGGGTPSFVGARAYLNTATQALNNNTNTPVQFDGESYDTDAFHDNVVNKTRFTAPVDGYYLMVANVTFAANATGTRQLFFMVNGTTVISNAVFPANTASVIYNTHAIYPLVAGDYVELIASQNSGGSLNIVGGNAQQTSAAISLMGV